jgi:hypothetical protein
MQENKGEGLITELRDKLGEGNKGRGNVGWIIGRD